MVLNLCSIYPYFETDNFDRDYYAELASVTSQNPTAGWDFCYYWTERLMWDKYRLNHAYGEFPGRYSGPGYVVQEQVGVIPDYQNFTMPQTPESAEKAPAMVRDLYGKTPQTPSRLENPARPISRQTTEVSKAHGAPVSESVQPQVDLIAMQTPYLNKSYEGYPQNPFGGYLKPKDTPASDSPMTDPTVFSSTVANPISSDTTMFDLPALPPAQGSHGLVKETDKTETSSTPQAINQSSVSTVGPEPDSQAVTPASLLAARLASPSMSNPVAAAAPLPTLLLPSSLFKDSTSGEVITASMFERRCLRRGAEIAIGHANVAVNRHTGRMSKVAAQEILARSLATTLASVIEKQSLQ